MADPRTVHAGVTQAAMAAIASSNVSRQLPASTQLSVIAPPPVTINGCTLPPPPVVVTIGAFQFNILDWQKAAKSNSKSMTFRGGIDQTVYTYLADLYADVSKKAFQSAINALRMAISTNAGPAARYKVNIGARTLSLFQTSGGWATFSKEYKGWSSNWDLPSGDLITVVSHITPDMFWVWRELVDGKAPIVKVDPPFGDSGHKWGLFVRWTDRKVGGQDEVEVTLKQLSMDWLTKIEYEIARVVQVGIDYLCKAITWSKLQDVRNYGTLFPNPTVQASVLAWQGVAQACGTNLPAQASGPPTECVPTPPPGLSMPWWKKYQAWLIGGGLLALGVGGVAYYNRSRSHP